MVNIHLISDIHLEYEDASLRDYKAPDGTDVVIVAGDTHPGVLGVIWAAQRFSGLPVYYIPGNHEYYGKRGFKRHVERMQEKAKEMGGNVTVCDGHEMIFEGTRFLLTTLWTDYDLYGTQEESMRAARARMNDYKNITQDLARGREMSPHTILEHHKTSLAFLEERLSIPYEGNTIVVTHHAPSPQSFMGDDEQAREDVAPCYASNLEDFILKYQPTAWFHGHLHKNVDYRIGETRIMSNPRGWVSSRVMKGGITERENEDWNPEFLVSFPPRPTMTPR